MAQDKEITRNIHGFYAKALSASVRTGGAPVDLASLVAPCSVEDFLGTHWRRQELFTPSAERPAPQAPFSIAELDGLFAAARRCPKDWSFFRAKDVVPTAEFVDTEGSVQLNRIAALYDEGGTIYLTRIERFVPALNRLSRSLSRSLHSTVRISLWLTRANHHPSYLHYDTHDIFVLQVHGRKHWKLYDLVPELFAPRKVDNTLDRRDVTRPPCLDQVLAPGDMLYLPAGAPHEVVTCDAHALHLAISVYPVLWRDLLDVAVPDAGRRDPALNAAVPPDLLIPRPGAADEIARQGLLCETLDRLLQQAVREADPAALAEHCRKEAIDDLPPPHDGHFAREVLMAASSTPLGDTILLRRRDNAPCLVQERAADGVARIAFPGGGLLEGPLALAPMLRAVAQAEGPFSADSLAAVPLDMASRRQVLQHLLQSGLLERVAP